ncbi:hypothetical protein CEXT_15081 [Caerostris extrusa]|uniref:Uncharacterized protein n=1 Tax=Caerostris extrusa TaxID=172846 RepID=A0AAV4MDQ3_CAEEX|nr:hypothetical protein CEXT_15081 [Caerostris extrusa]
MDIGSNKHILSYKRYYSMLKNARNSETLRGSPSPFTGGNPADSNPPPKIWECIHVSLFDVRLSENLILLNWDDISGLGCRNSDIYGNARSKMRTLSV